VSEYEVVIVQERYDVDPDLLTYLSSIGHRFSIVRPHLYDLINGVALRSYCAIARNQAVELAERDWVVFLSDGSDPDVAEGNARVGGWTVLAGSIDKPHGLRECMIIDDEGYVWIPSAHLP